MPVEYRYNSAEKLIQISCSGHLVIAEIFDYFGKIATDPSIQPNAVELVDLSEVTHFDVDFTQAATMPSGYVSAHEVKRIRGTILYGATKLNLGLAQLIRAHFRLTMPNHYFEVVNSRLEAREKARQLHSLNDLGSA